ILDYGKLAGTRRSTGWEVPGGRDGGRAADLDRSTLQPVLHQADRSPGRGLSRNPVLPDRSPSALRAGAPRAAVGHRAGPRAGPRRRLPEPYPPRLRAAPAAHADALQVRRPPEPSRADRAGPGRVRTARPALARGHRRDAGAAQPGRAAP